MSNAHESSTELASDDMLLNASFPGVPLGTRKILRGGNCRTFDYGYFHCGAVYFLCADLWF